MNAPANAPRTALESPTRPAMAETATLPLPNPKNRQKRKTGAMQRRKGNEGETEFCRALGEHLGETLARQLGAARDGGPDVLLGDRWAVEVKRGEALRLATWWQQACEQADKARRWPALAYRQNRQPWTVLVPLDIVMFGEAVWAWTVTDAHLDWAAAVSLAGFAAVVREANSE